MRKKVWLFVIVAALLVLVLGVFCACESYDVDPLKTVGDKNAQVLSNGGLVVKQGDYLYFVNGYVGYLTDKGKDNWFGNVKKGAIVRVSYKDGAIGNDYTVVVPKSVMASSENLGFSIFGNWIYYVSPSADEDRSGNVMTDKLQFLRTKLDGTDTQLILEWNDTSVKYKYTASALVYYDSTNKILYSKSLSAKKFDEDKKGDKLAEKVDSVHFLKNETYDPAVKTTPVADYVLYTQSATDSAENTLYITDPRGTDKKTLISYADPSYHYNVSVVASYVKEDKLTVYYTKSRYLGTSSSGTELGTFAYQFADKNFAFNAANEVSLSTTSLSSLFAFDGGVVKTGSNSVIYYADGTAPKTYGDLDLGTLIAIENGNFYYLNSDNKLLYYPLNESTNAHYAYTTEEKFMTSFIGAEYFDGYFYFILDDDYDYMACIKLADIDVYSEEGGATIKRVYVEEYTEDTEA